MEEWFGSQQWWHKIFWEYFKETDGKMYASQGYAAGDSLIENARVVWEVVEAKNGGTWGKLSHVKLQYRWCVTASDLASLDQVRYSLTA